MFRLEIETTNAAFGDDPGADRERELARILREVAARAETGQTSGAVHDYNGNTVGTWKLTDDR